MLPTFLLFIKRMEDSMTRKADFLIGIGTTIFAILIYMTANQMPVAETGLGAGGFPKFIALGLGVLGILLAIRSFHRIKSGDKDKQKVNLKELLNVAKLAVAVGLYIFVMRYIGFLIATPIFFFLFMYIYGERKWKQMVIISVALSIALYLIFEKGFQVMLPSGILF